MTTQNSTDRAGFFTSDLRSYTCEDSHLPPTSGAATRNGSIGRLALLNTLTTGYVYHSASCDGDGGRGVVAGCAGGSSRPLATDSVGPDSVGPGAGVQPASSRAGARQG